MNLLPGMILIVVLSALFAVLAHLWRGGKLLRMIFLFFFALVGFIIGQIIFQNGDSKFFVIGWVQAGWGSLSSLLVTLFGVWLTEIKKED